jgi:hypothetical protein
MERSLAAVMLKADRLKCCFQGQQAAQAVAASCPRVTMIGEEWRGLYLYLIR